MRTPADPDSGRSGYLSLIAHFHPAGCRALL